jgi:ADP-ribose pyrophosphatase YjhB (NUDIX family)
MQKLNASVSVGGLVFRKDEVLLVQITYGPNNGLWMLPGGFLEAGESIEETAMREVEEEAGIKALPERIVGIRSGVREIESVFESSLYVVFEMTYVSGLEKPDGNETSKAQFRKIDEVLDDPQVIDLSKEFIRNAIVNKGLIRADNKLNVNTKYKSYDYYV